MPVYGKLLRKRINAGVLRCSVRTCFVFLASVVSFFATVELPTMNSKMVQQIRVFVVADLDKEPK